MVNPPAPDVRRAEGASDALAHEPPPFVREPGDQVRVATRPHHLPGQVWPQIELFAAHANHLPCSQTQVMNMRQGGLLTLVCAPTFLSGSQASHTQHGTAWQCAHVTVRYLCDGGVNVQHLVHVRMVQHLRHECRLQIEQERLSAV